MGRKTKRQLSGSDSPLSSIFGLFVVFINTVAVFVIPNSLEMLSAGCLRAREGPFYHSSSRGGRANGSAASFAYYSVRFSSI